MALLFRRTAALVLPNLQASFVMGLGAAAFLLAVALRAPGPAYLVLKFAVAGLLWMTFSWLAFNARAAFEDAHSKAGLAQLRCWLAGRGRERALSFGMALVACLWLGLALNFYQWAAGRTWAATAALALTALLAYLLASTLALNLALASRIEASFLAEWKAALFMALAFAPHCLGALCILALLSGAGAFVLGTQHWWGRLLWAPALALPLFGAAFSAAFLVALSDEFLAKSHGEGPPAYEPFKFGELMRPWR